MLPDLLQVVVRVAATLEALGVPYVVGGSVASSRYGVPRTTQDVDLIADLRLKHVAALVQALQDEFYIDAHQIREAIRRKSCFNLIHLVAAHKIDVFVLPSAPWAREELRRRRKEPIGTSDSSTSLFFCSPEDIILHKLEWYRQGSGVSSRQWSDVVGVLKIQQPGLDFAYLHHWADQLGLKELLESALADAAIPQSG